MRLRMITTLACLLLCLTAHAGDREEITALFGRYMRVVNQHQTEGLSEVFTSRFLQREGGAQEYAQALRSTPTTPVPTYTLNIPPNFGDRVFVKLVVSGETPSDSSFIVVRQGGGWKIDGTMNADE